MYANLGSGSNTGSGILRDKTLADKLMYIPNNDTQITPSVYYNYWLKRYDTQLIKIQL